MDTISAVFILVASIIDLRNGILIIFKKREKLILLAQMSFFILEALQVDEELKNKLLENYKMNIKEIGWYTIIGSIALILISIKIL